MVVYHTILILTILLAAICAEAGQSHNQCLDCHTVHYRQQGACTACHRGNPASGRKNIAHAGLIAGKFARFTLPGSPELQKGDRLLEQFACRRCHVSNRRGNRLAASLDSVTQSRSSEEIVTAITSPAMGMPLFRIGDKQMVALVNALYGGGRNAKSGAKRPQVVFFQDKEKKAPDLFTKKCGVCHRILSERLGLLGSSDSGPNLSGLFTPFYPKTFRNREVWNAGGLKQWLDNPRSIRTWTTMQPVRLDSAELREVISILKVEAQQKEPVSSR